MEYNNFYWVGILSQVYYSKKKNEIFLYNTITGDSVKSNELQCIDLLESMHKRENLGVVLLKEETPIIKTFITECILKGIFIKYEYNANALKPIHLMPILNLQNDVKRGEYSFSGNLIMENLLDVYLYLNGKCSLFCDNCNNYFKQTLFCTKNNEGELEKQLLVNLIEQLPLNSLRNLCLMGGDIFYYSHLDFLIKILTEKEIKCVFVEHYLNINHTNYFRLSKSMLEILVTSPIKEEWFSENISLITNKNIKYKFIVSSQVDYEEIEKIITKYNLENYLLSPFYNQNNELFFIDNVYIEESDILLKEENKQRHIFAHQKLNTNNFGRIYIYPNGDVKSNVLMRTIGNIKEDTLSKIVRKEIIENTSWRLIRDNKPCNDCLYQYLCPSPSNYELIIGKNNLCHIK